MKFDEFWGLESNARAVIAFQGALELLPADINIVDVESDPEIEDA